MFQQIAIILLVLLVLGFLAWHFMVILQHVLGIWEKIQIILKPISYVIAVVMNYLMSPNQLNGTVKPWRIGIWCLLNIFILTVFQYTLVDLYLFGASFALLGFHLLIIISKMVMIGEDNLIIEGMLHKEKAKFRDLQGAIPFAVLIIASLMFILSLTVSVSALDKVLPGLVFQLHDEVNFSNWLIMMILQILPFSEFFNLDMNNMPLHPTLTYGSALVMGIKLTIGVIVYSTIMLQLKQIKQIKLLIKAFESDESDIQYLQQRATRFPSIVKKELINLALTHPDPEVRKRAILVAPHAPIISFPQAFIYNLNREKQEDLKELGLRQILKILSDSTVVLDETRRNQISNHLNFQITKKHSDIVIRLMHEVEEKILSTPNHQPTTEAPMINLEDLCKNYKVFFDTSSLMQEDAGNFFLNLVDVLKRTNSKILLPKRVLNELSAQSANVSSAAKFGLKRVELLAKNNWLDLHWEENEIVGGSKNFADPVFPMVFIKNRLQHNLCLITQDTDLAIE
ncbi:MAG: hypothetical protein BWK78_07590 [Thiotrichaceae bacterium IS1]|nr:MAG: hypothetical protein BWK78_07590 [Thiotrichaceae bacterium IS1]